VLYTDQEGAVAVGYWRGRWHCANLEVGYFPRREALLCFLFPTVLLADMAARFSPCLLQDLDQACSTVAEKDPTEKGGGSADTLTDEEKRAKAKAERNKPATLPLPSLEDKHLVDVTLMSKCAGHGKPVSCIRWHPNKALLVSASKDGTARVWSASDGKEVAVLPTASGLPPAVADAGASRITCRSCAISPAGDAIYTVQVRKWEGARPSLCEACAYYYYNLALSEWAKGKGICDMVVVYKGSRAGNRWYAI
jgi:hypothetical protein